MHLGYFLSINILCLFYMNCKLSYTSLRVLMGSFALAEEKEIYTANVFLSTAGTFQGSSHM